jgi:hypothetical protein
VDGGDETTDVAAYVIDSAFLDSVSADETEIRDRDRPAGAVIEDIHRSTCKQEMIPIA